MSRYPKLPDELNQLLHQIQPSRVEHINFYPCCVTLRSGTTMDYVYVQDEISYIKTWGVYPEEDHGKSSIKIEEVKSLTESPSRLPASFATELYKAGETRMGGHEFTVEFSDGVTVFYVGGNAIDFIDYPPGKSQNDVVAVRNGGRGTPQQRPRYFWCLHS
jgi:hypothetical protein